MSNQLYYLISLGIVGIIGTVTKIKPIGLALNATFKALVAPVKIPVAEAFASFDLASAKLTTVLSLENAKYDAPGDSYKVEVPFEHMQYERLVNVADGANTNAQWGWSADIKQQPNLGKPLLFYPILKTQQIGVIDSNGTLTSQASIYIPSNSVSTSLINILSTDGSENINFNAEKNEFTNVPYQKTLFDQYYKNYVTEIFKKQKAVDDGATTPVKVTKEEGPDTLENQANREKVTSNDVIEDVQEDYVQEIKATKPIESLSEETITTQKYDVNKKSFIPGKIKELFYSRYQRREI